jgi:hypothetical protein
MHASNGVGLAPAVRPDRWPELMRRMPSFVASFALQHGVPVDVIRKALMRDSEGRASGPLAAALDNPGQVMIAADDTIDRVVEIERLAALDPIVYEVTRAEAAKRLGMRAHVLDRAVRKKRRELGLETDNEDDGQGRAVKIVDVLPWHELVDGDMIATTLAAAVKTFAVLPDAAADAIALWTLHTWLVNSFMISPRLAVVSPTKGCGKTTVLRVLHKIVRRPKRAGSISPPALFRAVAKFQPTILLDETEKFIEHGSDLHGLLCEGHAQGGNVMRVLGENLELREFAVFSAVAYARNGKLPDDLEQRSIVIEMQRRRADETVTDLRDDRCEPLHRVARHPRTARQAGPDVRIRRRALLVAPRLSRGLAGCARSKRMVFQFE